MEGQSDTFAAIQSVVADVRKALSDEVGRCLETMHTLRRSHDASAEALQVRSLARSLAGVPVRRPAS